MSSERPVRYDLSPLVTPQLGVWPGDTMATREVRADLARGDNLTLSTLRTTVHVGAHADAPSHTESGTATIDEVDLDRYVGRCQVVRTRVERGGEIGIDDFSNPLTCPRVLLATSTFPDPERFTTDFAVPSLALVDALADAGVVLLGTDAPSVDHFASKDLVTHGRLAHHGMAILEGLVLDDVPEGEYELLALPLRLAGFDASPVRAVLRDPG